MIRSRCRLSHWFPAVQSVLDPKLYPRTDLVMVEATHAESLCDPDDQPTHDAAVARIRTAIESGIGYPAFLRSDLVSGKHVFPDAVGVIASADDLGRAVAGIAEFAAMVIWFGDQGTDTWVVRELLTSADATRSVKGLPIGSEWRLIVRGGIVTPESGFYWPSDALINNDYRFRESPEACAEVRTYVDELEARGYPDALNGWSLAVASQLGDDWSVDWMHTTDGWKLIDMALAAESWIPHPLPGSDLTETNES